MDVGFPLWNSLGIKLFGGEGEGRRKRGRGKGKKSHESIETNIPPHDEHDASPQIVANQNNFRFCHVSDDRCESVTTHVFLYVSSNQCQRPKFGRS